MLKGSIEQAVLKTQKRRVAQAIFSRLQSAMLPFDGLKVALAVSGGLDSRALMEAVARWPKRNQYQFYVVTVNHQTRQESAFESCSVVERALALGFDAKVLTIYPGSRKDEASLRNARYAAISHFLMQNQIPVLCTAHQMDDNAEGVFMDLFGLGGGRLGSGMKAQRGAEFGSLVRPFLNLERRELLVYLTSIGVTDYFLDPSNIDNSGARQKARDFLRCKAFDYHPKPIERFAHEAELRLEEIALVENYLNKQEKSNSFRVGREIHAAELRYWLKGRYIALCPDRDPRNAASIIEAIIKKAKGLRIIDSSGVDPVGNSITLVRPAQWKFDLPGAKALMTPELVSLFRN